MKLPTKLIKMLWPTTTDNRIKWEEITSSENIKEIFKYRGRMVLLDSIIKEYKNTNLLSGDKPHNSKLIPAFENGEQNQKKLVITEYGCSLDSSQPAFYEIDLKTNTWHERVPQKKNSYFVINFGAKQIPAHSLSCLAFVKNENPNELLAPDHINDFDDGIVLYETYQLYRRMKLFAKLSGKTWHGLEPDKISWSPDNLQWLSREGNSNKANGTEGWEEAFEKQQRFVKYIEDGDQKIKHRATIQILKNYDELEKMKDISDHGDYLKRKQNQAVMEAQEFWYDQYEDDQIHYGGFERCVFLGKRAYVEEQLINNTGMYGEQTELIDDFTGTLFTHSFEQKEIPVLDFIEKYVACSHMNSWGDAMWDDVLEWVGWVNNHGYIGSEKNNPKLKIVGHKILGSYGEWPEIDNGTSKYRAGAPYLFDMLHNFAGAIHYSKKAEQKLRKKLDKQNYKLVA